MILRVQKKIGETCLEVLKKVVPENEKATYAGRLDPMASGEMIILTGEDVHKKEYFTNKIKTYTVEYIEGIQTDSHDILGIPISLDNKEKKQSFYINNINNVGGGFPYTFYQKYPYFSSRTIQGKPLWQWFREGKIDQIEVPGKLVTLFDFKILEQEEEGDNNVRSISSEELFYLIRDKIQMISSDNDFRQEEIIKAWKNFFHGIESSRRDKKFVIKKFCCTCSSGAYMRSLCHEMNAVALHIHRNAILDSNQF